MGNNTAESIVAKLVDLYRKSLLTSLSSGQVAGALLVSDATVKRWSDAGLIRCHRTPGGHRKYTAQDVADFMNGAHYARHGGAPIPYAVVDVLPSTAAVSEDCYTELDGLRGDGRSVLWQRDGGAPRPGLPARSTAVPVDARRDGEVSPVSMRGVPLAASTRKRVVRCDRA